MKHVGIIGYGALGKQLERFCSQQYESVIYHYYDDLSYKAGLPASKPFAEWKNMSNDSKAVLLGLGYNQLKLRHTIIAQLCAKKITLLSTIHSSVLLADSVKADVGVHMYPGCILDEGVQIGKGTILNNGVIVSHDSSIGESSFIAPGVVVSGRVKIGDRSFIGAGSIIANDVQIGDDVIVGLGTVVSKSIPSGLRVIGNPMKVVEKLRLV